MCLVTSLLVSAMDNSSLQLFRLSGLYQPAIVVVEKLIVFAFVALIVDLVFCCLAFYL